MFDFTSFIIGLLLGMIIMLLLVWIGYYTRTFLFTYCAVQTPPCSGDDYYNNPGDALANNPSITVADILFLNDEEEMYYKRVPRTGSCVPESNQLVYLRNPQYCTFSSSTGNTGSWKQVQFGSSIYQPEGFSGPTITADADCQPNAGQSVTSGLPQLRWDAS